MSAREIKCFLYRAAGKTAMLLAAPFYAIDLLFTFIKNAVAWLCNGVELACAFAVIPNVIFYDWCVKRHNAIRALGAEK